MTEKNIEGQESEKTVRIPKTVGEVGWVRVNIFADEFSDVGVNNDMLGAEASQIIRNSLGLAERQRTKDPINAVLKNIKALAKEKGMLEDLKKLEAKLQKA